MRNEHAVRNFRELHAWQKAHALTLAVYRATASFPREEQYGLTGQMWRSCASIAANIAEGCGRGGSVELARFMQIARGSASELEYHLLLAHDLSMLPAQTYDHLAAALIEVQRMLTSYRQSLMAQGS